MTRNPGCYNYIIFKGEHIEEGLVSTLKKGAHLIAFMAFGHDLSD